MPQRMVFIDSVKGCKHVQIFLLKMASAAGTSKWKSLTANKVLERLFADADSADEVLLSDSDSASTQTKEDKKNHEIFFIKFY